MPLRVQITKFREPDERDRMVNSLRRSPEDAQEYDMRQRFLDEHGTDAPDDDFKGAQTGLSKTELKTEMLGLIDALRSGDVSNYPNYDDMVSDFSEAFPDDPLLDELDSVEREAD